MSEVLFKTSYAGSTVTVYESHLEWKMLFQKQSIPIGQVASVDIKIPLYAGVVIETTGGKKFKIPVAFNKKQELADAIFEAQTGGRRDNHESVNDLERLAELRDKKIITEDEFNTKKKQILGI